MPLGCPLCRFLKIFQKVMGLITPRRSTNSTSRPVSFGIMGCLLCHFLVIFRKVFESFMVSLAAHAVKPVILGHDPDFCPSENIGVPEQGSSNSGSRATVEDGALDSRSLRASSVDKELSLEKTGANADDKKKEGRIAGKGRGLRKMVSINDNVKEFFIDSKTKRAKWPSMEGEKDEIKPLKSILKVGSKQR